MNARKLMLTSILFYWLLISCNNSTSLPPILDLIPTPHTMDSNGQWSKINTITPNQSSLDRLGRYNNWINSWPIKKGSKANLILKEDTTNGKHGSYKLDILENQIEIIFSGDAGLTNALSTLQQLMMLNQDKLPQVSITDQSGFAYRGMHLDVARHFYSVADIKKYIDYLSLYKYNTFHWHLTDDQGWRIEIKKYPKLQEISAYRSETLVGHYNDMPHKFDGVKYGGFYTQDQIKEIVKYAGDRGIDVIPEIDIPGHSTAILAAYPEFGCTGNKIEPATKWGVFFDVLCPKEKTFEFLEDIFTEVAELFPATYVHIGGDECPKEQWKESAFCQNLMKEKGLSDELALQSYFITRVSSIISKLGKKIIGWDEILEGGIGTDATIMSWRGSEGGISAAKKTNDVIMTPNSHCYFDYYQSEHTDEPLSIGGYLPFQKVYNWSVIPKELEEASHKYILGGQGNVWTEYMKDFDHVEYMMMTRMITLSEVLWGRQQSDLKSFTELLLTHITFWESKGVNIANHILDLSTKISIDKNSGVSVGLSSELDAVELYAQLPGENTFKN